MYEIIVGNIGTVLTTREFRRAMICYNQYIAQSKENVGRAAGESVTWMKDGEIMKEYIGTVERD